MQCLCCNYLVIIVFTLATQLNCSISFSYAELFVLFFSVSRQLICLHDNNDESGCWLLFCISTKVAQETPPTTG